MALYDFSPERNPESATLCNSFSDICSCIPEQDVVSFADELLQDGLRILYDDTSKLTDDEFDASTRAKVPAVTTIRHLVVDAIAKVSGSPSMFDKFVSILEKRDSDLASRLKLEHRLECLRIPDQNELSPPRNQRKVFSAECNLYVTSLRLAYKVPPPHWEPLPRCQHIKLSMIKRKGNRQGIDETTAVSRALGEVGKFLSTTTVQDLDSDRIFDAGIFDEDRQVILVEGVSGMGKTSLAYYYCQKWLKGELKMFDFVILVRLRDFAACEADLILPNLLASASSMKPITKKMARAIMNNRKVLIILDGWDEAPISCQDLMFFLDNLLKSVSSKTRILITSRPESSLELHSLANRVEILGFTTHDIHSYFRKALQSQIQTDQLESALAKLRDHLRDKPVIKSCCYVPLNSAILAYIYLNRKQTLPVTRWELFLELILCCIVKETSTSQPHLAAVGISSFDHLPADLKCQLDRLSLLAFERMKQNKIIFTQEDLEISSTLGLLHCVKGFGSVFSQVVTYNFIHLSVQELLAAYHMSQLDQAEHSKEFKLLLNNNKFQVLEFYAGLTKLSNKGVQDIIITSFRDYFSESLVFKCFMNCIFEAQISDPSFYQLVPIKDIQFVDTFLSSIDCLSMNYFLFYIQRKMQLVVFMDCSIDSNSLDLLLSNLAIIDESTEAVIVTGNKITDHGVDCIVKALASTCLTTLMIGDSSVTDIGARQLLNILPRCMYLEDFELRWRCDRPDQLLADIKTQVEELSQLREIRLVLSYPNNNEEQEEVIVTWFWSVCRGVRSLISSLEYSKADSFHVVTETYLKTTCFPSELEIAAQVDESLQESVSFVNQDREVNDHLRVTFVMNNHNSQQYYCTDQTS